jgi:glutathione S-transferase
MLTYYFHPFSSFCWKALIALYENQTPFEPHVLHLQHQEVREAFARISPMAKMPALTDGERAVWEASIVIEYLDQIHPGKTRFIPDDPAKALEVRRMDRMLDLYIHEQMQKIVGDHLRPEAARDRYGVEEAHRRIERGYDYLESVLPADGWACGEDFSLADCAAFPALFYANAVRPFGERAKLGAYFARLKERPSVERVLEEARPLFHMFPAGRLE